MCGICGIRRFGPEPIKEEQISILLNMNERRGNQATGLALQDPDGSIHVFKNDEPAWRVTSSTEYQDFLKEHLNEETIAFIGHARLATKGSPRQAENNHPLFHGETAVVHNGHISNDDFLFKDLKLDRKGEVDSDIIRAILDDKGFTKEAITTLNRMCGSAAIACLSTKYPGKVLLARSGNPIVLASNDNYLVWSSEKQAIHTAMRPFVKRWGFYFQANKVDLGFLTMNNDSAYILGECIEWHQPFRVASYFRQSDYSDIHARYASSRKRFKYNDGPTDVKPKIAWCGTCQAWLTIPKHLRSLAPSELICRTCKKALAEAPEQDCETLVC